MKQFTIYFDGGCVPNPGRGYGSYEIVCNNNLSNGACLLPIRKSRIDFGEQMTNNMAEYQSLLCALERLFQESIDPTSPIVVDGVCNQNMHITILTDSALVRNCLNNGWKVRKPHLQVLNQKARDWLKEFGHWTIKWNPRQRNVERFGH